jgi:hypothetical protein
VRREAVAPGWLAPAEMNRPEKHVKQEREKTNAGKTTIKDIYNANNQNSDLRDSGKKRISLAF